MSAGQRFTGPNELISAFGEYRRRVRRVATMVVTLLAGFSVLIWWLLERLSPKDLGAYTWVVIMSAVFLSALRLGRHYEATLALVRPCCPSCAEGLSGTWADLALRTGNCPVCEEALFVVPDGGASGVGPTLGGPSSTR